MNAAKNTPNKAKESQIRDRRRTGSAGEDTIVVYAIDEAKGTLTQVASHSTGGKEPRSFEIDPTGTFLFAENQKSDNIVVFRIDQKTGRLTPTGKILEVASPVCVKFVATE